MSTATTAPAAVADGGATAGAAAASNGAAAESSVSTGTAVGTADSTTTTKINAPLQGLSMLPAPSLQLARSLLSVHVEDLSSMTAFGLFQSQMESGSVEASVDAMKRLGVVAAAMESPEQVSAQLVPYLTQLVLQQPPLVDELLLVLGQQLPAVADVLHDPAYLLDFLPMMERLAAVEETVVRDQAVKVLNEFASRVKKAATDASNTSEGGESTASGKPTWADPSPWVSMTKRLAAADWFTAKVSACGILHSVLDLLPASSAFAASVDASAAPPEVAATLELLGVYKDLCADETPMVRRAAAKHLGQAVKVAGWPHKEWAATQFTLLCRDEQDSVRLLAVAALADVGPVFGKESMAHVNAAPAAGAAVATSTPWTLQHWLPLIKDGSTDLSWRVRNNLAKTFSDVASVLGISGDPRYPNEQSLVMACFVALLRDAEAEVRAAAVGHLARMVAWGGPTHFATHLQALLPSLADDFVMEVRSKCALALMDAAHGGTLEDNVILGSFGPRLESFLQDEFQEVQLQVLTNLHKISHLLPGLTGVVSSLLQMAKANNWRVREAIAKLLPHLAEARGLEFFQSVLLEPAWLTLLQDTVACVRNAAVHGMPLLVRVAGEDWFLQHVYPQHAAIMNAGAATSYLQRTTILHTYIACAVATATTTAGPLWQETATQMLRCATTDPVANVRMVAMQGFTKVATAGSETEGDESAESLMPAAISFLETQAKPALEQRLAEEEDADCRFCCQAALDAMATMK